MSEGKIIKTFIKESGVSVTEIAKRINVDRRTIYSYMKKDNLKPETLRQLSIACGKEANYLLKKILEKDEEQDVVKEGNSLYTQPSAELDELNRENKKLLKKLVELQEKHIKLHEEYLNFKKESK